MSPSYRRTLLQRGARFFDLTAASVTFLAAATIDTGSFNWPSLEQVLILRIKIINIFLAGGYLALCSVIFSTCGFYLSHRLSPWTRRVREILTAVSCLVAVMLILRWPFELEFASNRFLIVFWTLTFGIFTVTRMIGQQLLYYFRTRGQNLRSVVIVGEGGDVAVLANRIESDAALGYRVVGIIDATEGISNERVASIR